jgi:glycosyltransferase involved in cell wall biosynthesis
VDDGSTDNSKEIIVEYVSKDNRIHYYWEPNSGTPAKPKNLGFTYARGEYVAYLDQDDEWLPEKLEKQLAVFQKNSNEKIGLVSCSAYPVNEKGFPKAIPPVMKKEVTLVDLLHYNYVFSNSSVMIPSAVIRAVGDRDESKEIGYYEDWDMWVRIMASGYTLRFIEEPLFRYATHAENMCRTVTKIKQAEMLVSFYQKHRALCVRNHIEHVFLKTIGLYYALAKNSKEARVYYKKSIAIKKTYITPYLGIVLTCVGAGATDRALEFWHKIKRWQVQ